MKRAGKVLAVVLVAALVMALAAPATGLAIGKGGKDDAKHAGPKIDPGPVALAPFMPDLWEDDDTTQTATPIDLDELVDGQMYVEHTLDGVAGSIVAPSAVADSVATCDEDWYTFWAAEGDVFYCETTFLAGASDFDTEIGVYDEANVQVEYEDDSDYFPSYAGEIVFEAPHDGQYFLRVRPLGGFNTSGVYGMWFGTGCFRRAAGPNRYATAATLSGRFWDNAVTPSYGTYPNCMVVANGARFSDALIGGVLASANGGQLLLTAPDALPQETADEVARALTSSFFDYYSPVVFVMGGEDAVSAEVAQEIGNLAMVDDVVRVGGADRYETGYNAAMLSDADDMLGNRAFVVSGEAWPDGLSASALACNDYSALLLVRPDSVPTETIDAIADLGVTNVVIIGGVGVVSQDVQDDLAALPGVTTVERVAGPDRYETSRLVAEWGNDNDDFYNDTCIIATGRNFADALAAGPFSWNMWEDFGVGEPVLLTPGDEAGDALVQYLDDNDVFDMGYILGGTAAISEDAHAEIDAAATFSQPL
ncbi:MAG: hypothetical protein FDZ70_01540 [Actinobacteria bacterium]|nr:MAG: hypothetical protein FDZ70_01540 [Actinomycetota bacterium]